MSKLDNKEINLIASTKKLKIINPESYINLDSSLSFECQVCKKRITSDIRTVRNESFFCPSCEGQKVQYVPNPPAKTGYRLIGFDQATSNFGISVYDDGKLVYYDCITFVGTLETRLAKISIFVDKVCQLWEPDYVVLEDIQMQGAAGYHTFKTLAMLLGICVAMLTKNDIPNAAIFNKVWQARFLIKGDTRAKQKRNVIEKVKLLFSIDVTDDIADAILIGKYGLLELRKKDIEFT